MALGTEGAARHYVPESVDVLFHTALTLPEQSDTMRARHAGRLRLSAFFRPLTG